MSQSSPRAWACGAILLATAAASPAFAANYQIFGSVDQLFGPPNISRNIDSFRKTSGSPLSDGINAVIEVTDPFVIRQAGFVYSSADVDGAHVRLNTEFRRAQPFSLTNTGFFLVRSSGAAYITFTDMILSGSSGPITTSLNTHLTGLLDIGLNQYTNSANAALSAAASVSVVVLVNGSSVVDGYFALDGTSGSTPTTGGYGPIQHFDGDDVITSNSFTLQPNVPFSVTLQLSIQATGVINDDGAGVATGLADFSNTLAFVLNAPVFNLPAGYTVNSASANIVNNQFIPIPEPTSAFFLLAAAPLALRRRRSA